MRILIIEPGKYPRAAEIPHSLQKMQDVVDGTIQAVYPWPERAALVCNDEGLLREFPFNRRVGEHLIFGTFFICGIDECDFADLPDELMERFSEELRSPEVLVRVLGGHITVPVEVDEE